MALSDVNWKGTEAIIKMAEILPSKIAGNRLKEAYKYALTETLTKMQSMVPRGGTGKLWYSIAITVTGGPNIENLKAIVGPRRKRFTWNQQGWHAHLIEKGTKPHTITVSTSNAMPIYKNGKQLGFQKSVDHPGTRAFQPFKRSIDLTWPQVGKKASEKVRQLMAVEIENIKKEFGNVASK